MGAGWAGVGVGGAGERAVEVADGSRILGRQGSGAGGRAGAERRGGLEGAAWAGKFEAGRSRRVDGTEGAGRPWEGGLGCSAHAQRCLRAS